MSSWNIAGKIQRHQVIFVYQNSRRIVPVWIRGGKIPPAICNVVTPAMFQYNWNQAVLNDGILERLNVDGDHLLLLMNLYKLERADQIAACFIEWMVAEFTLFGEIICASFQPFRQLLSLADSLARPCVVI